MIRVSGMKIRIPHDEVKLHNAIRRQAKGMKPLSYRIVRRSIDARKKPELYYVYTIDAQFSDERKLLHMKGSKWTKINAAPLAF